MAQNKTDTAKSPGASRPGTPDLTDPLALWRQALNDLEQRFNSLGNQSLRTPEATRLMHQFAATSLQLQNGLEEMLAKYFKLLNLPSRKDIQELMETVRSLEEKVDRLLVTPDTSQAPRPARTRLPPSAAVEAPVDAQTDASIAPTVPADAGTAAPAPRSDVEMAPAPARPKRQGAGTRTRPATPLKRAER